MFFKKYILAALLLLAGNSYAQSDDFCNAVLTISRDAPNEFRNIRGNLKESHQNAAIWASGITVPGSIGSRFVKAMGLFYECAFFQSRNKEQVKAVYEKYRDQLNSCLLHEGFTLSMQPNFYPGLAEYKKLVFMQDVKEDAPPGAAPSHITLEATYNKDIKQYTIVLFIFEH